MLTRRIAAVFPSVETLHATSLQQFFVKPLLLVILNA